MYHILKPRALLPAFYKPDIAYSSNLEKIWLNFKIPKAATAPQRNTKRWTQGWFLTLEPEVQKNDVETSLKNFEPEEISNNSIPCHKSVYDDGNEEIHIAVWAKMYANYKTYRIN
jgi:hypothetical protein